MFFYLKNVLHFILSCLHRAYSDVQHWHIRCIGKIWIARRLGRPFLRECRWLESNRIQNRQAKTCEGACVLVCTNE